MAENIIKDFVKKQTTPLNIGVPKQRPQQEVPEVRIAEPVQEPVRVEAAVAQKPHVGRPKGEIQKVKMSVYVPEEAKAKLIKIQHINYKQNLNDVLLEAIMDIIKKYGE